ncbi:hypothetical protein A2966_04955 [Candidatus Roizmanbacteria bacterium RIFCSPLOWO2_01_FULL_41_22]|uniref:RNA polymerase sigma-70 region 4 domain-containing protein n=2 Tax=Candidatus Roizmaniibacteriota TaxID=1752723 RepID=A0A1F7JQS8_9BACT|nr:MAG: hypothetical protein A2966_04955 [Candidatus Roizmanbacteria bacterium RIFCSPLOWO2_01_FULL_41_22]OGK57967.1 MAG: hypothetical protein A3H86_03305 [Candidatus Roizmanbacteria bacterium RIFCSPLOWO2_02_FULL_41_9]
MSNQTLVYFINFILRSKKLTLKEEDILVRRLRRKKLKQIGRKYKLTDERIRQIEKAALVKLQSKIYQERLI